MLNTLYKTNTRYYNMSFTRNLTVSYVTAMLSYQSCFVHQRRNCDVTFVTYDSGRVYATFNHLTMFHFVIYSRQS